ncbi:MAG: hypothetical protein ACI82G_002615, partial [Bradymonadia bacterium]
GIPVASVWFGSSLAAFENRATWLPFVAGVLLFPVVPILWELWASRRRVVKERKRDSAPKPRILTFSDRMLFRTFGLNALALGIIFGVMPTRAADAVAVRGDWFLEQASGEWVDPARQAVSWLSERAQVLRELERADAMTRVAEEGAEDDDGGSSDDGANPNPNPNPAPVPPGVEAPSRRADRDSAWPHSDDVHPVVQHMPASVQSTWGSVAHYIAANTQGDFDTLRALHAWIGTNIAYDSAALARGEYPPQDADTVFRNRVGVCAGYARLLRAMGTEAGLHVEYIVGVSRDATGAIAGVGHAWNAVELQAGWMLVDVTWDAGHSDGSRFIASYGTNNLGTPPNIFGISHLPENDIWQLRDSPITRSEFSKLPMMRPEFYARGLELLHPDRSQTTVDTEPVIRVRNPGGTSLIATVQDVDTGSDERCRVSGRESLEIGCPMRDGQYRVMLFAADDRLGQHQGVGSLEFNVR